MNDHLLIIGIMTGNSLDGADAVLTKFYKDGRIEDVESVFLPAPSTQYEELRKLRTYINDNRGNMALVAKTYPNFEQVLESYTQFTAQAVQALLRKASMAAQDVDLIGLHGQTCAHHPPSQAKTARPYTVQLGDGNRLAMLTGIAVAFDFRSDDLLAGGEGAPLAPMHNKHIGQPLGFPVTFINGGNTSNIAHIVHGRVLGWDAGPFNHFPDLLARQYFQKSCDVDGAIGRQGKIHEPLLRELFEQAAVTASGRNFLEITPPKSSDPQWYKTVPLLEDARIAPEDKLRTAEYFSAYVTFHTLKYTPDDMRLPSRFAVFGGGWHNPVIMEDFNNLLQGVAPVVLPAHAELFDRLRTRFETKPEVHFSEYYGYDGRGMEARIFADLAYSLVIGRPFTTPELTGAKVPVVCGVLAEASPLTQNLSAWIAASGTNLPRSAAKWSRASAAPA
jgi:anhydro-N-acetylmuramic acid kinase